MSYDASQVDPDLVVGHLADVGQVSPCRINCYFHCGGFPDEKIVQKIDPQPSVSFDDMPGVDVEICKSQNGPN